MIEHDITVTVADLKITPGDILVCDGDGVTRVPVDIASDVAKQCAEVRSREGKSHTYFTSAGFSIDRWRKDNLGG